jgi:hypothetical protein
MRTIGQSLDPLGIRLADPAAAGGAAQVRFGSCAGIELAAHVSGVPDAE